MAIRSKELAEHYFQQAVTLEKAKREKKVQQFDEVFGLYKEAIKIDPSHAGALINLAYLYLERQPKNIDEIDDNRAFAREYYEKAAQLGHAGAQHNLRLLDMVILSDLAGDYESLADFYEKGLKDKCIPNPSEAIKMYQQAEEAYNRLIGIANTELKHLDTIQFTGLNPKFTEYKTMLLDNKEFAEIDRASLQNMQLRNSFYMEGLACEKKIAGDGKPDYASAMAAYKKAAVLGHSASQIMCNYLSCREERTKKAIALRERAIALGNTNAMLDQAYIYEQGQGNNGIPQYDKAIALYEKACELGNKIAKTKIDKLADNLLTMAKSLCLKKDQVNQEVQLEENIHILCKVMGQLAELYQQGCGSNGVAESEKAKALHDQIKSLKSLKRLRIEPDWMNKENILEQDIEPVLKRPRMDYPQSHFFPSTPLSSLRFPAGYTPSILRKPAK